MTPQDRGAAYPQNVQGKVVAAGTWGGRLPMLWMIAWWELVIARNACFMTEGNVRAAWRAPTFHVRNGRVNGMNTAPLRRLRWWGVPLFIVVEITCFA